MKTISFAVTDEQAAEIEHYATVMGHGRSSNLARLATIREMKRYPLKAPRLTLVEKVPTRPGVDASGGTARAGG